MKIQYFKKREYLQVKTKNNKYHSGLGSLNKIVLIDNMQAYSM